MYQPHILRFVSWVRDTEGIIDLVDLWPSADELASRYLQLRLEASKSLSALSTERSALRFFCQDRHLFTSQAYPRQDYQIAPSGSEGQEISACTLAAPPEV